MLMVAQIKDDKKNNVPDDCEGFEKLKMIRSQVPAVTHVDYSARVQTVSRDDNPLYYDTIHAFYRKTGCPIIINTSFNVRGEPLVLAPRDAYKCFMRTEMDYLIMGSFLLNKKEQPPVKKDTGWQKEFELD
jgi:carbamoyltransferase